MSTKMPSQLRIEHHEFHRMFAEAIGARGETGSAAKDFAEILFKHFAKEEDFAIPPLVLLPELAKGKIEPSMREMLVRTDKLKQRHAELLEDHRKILEGLEQLAFVAKGEDKKRIANFAERLIDHAKLEEEIIYPSSLLIGEYLRLKLP